MSRASRGPWTVRPGTRRRIFWSGSRRQIIFFGLLIALITLISFRAGAAESLAKGRTLAFATLSLSQLIHVFNYRSFKISIFRRGPAGNRSLILSVLVSAAAQLAVLLAPLLMDLFGTEPLSTADSLTVSGLILVPLAGGELWKLFAKNKSYRERG